MLPLSLGRSASSVARRRCERLAAVARAAVPPVILRSAERRERVSFVRNILRPKGRGGQAFRWWSGNVASPPFIRGGVHRRQMGGAFRLGPKTASRSRVAGGG